MRREGANAANGGRKEERGGWIETEMRLRLKKGITKFLEAAAGGIPGEKNKI